MHMREQTPENAPGPTPHSAIDSKPLVKSRGGAVEPNHIQKPRRCIFNFLVTFQNMMLNHNTRFQNCRLIHEVFFEVFIGFSKLPHVL